MSGHKRALLGLLAALMLSGCATDDPEADAFFRSGWLWPKSLDQGYQQPPPTDDAAPRER